MALIQVLDSETIDKIAAGEVVERPSSVVKELVENAIDAGATAVTVEARDGGIEFLRIADNGSGMAPDQVRTAFLRHATSKIRHAEDLTCVASLGFRGEALSSIAAVSKVELITKTADALTGVRYCMEGAVEKSFEEVGAPQGTTFIMRNLFFNTPVRRKFLKQPATEGGYIADLMEHMALSRPDISFKFQLNNQLRFHTSGNGDLKEVIYRIYGRDTANMLVPVQYEKDGIRIEGYLGKPAMVRANRNFEIYFLNGRFIRSQLISRAIEEGYKEYLMQHKFPFCVLHIVMDPEKVDVNVHPTKMDVRFAEAASFFPVLTGAVREALQKREMIPEVSLEKEKKPEKQPVPEQKKTPEPYELNRSSQYKVMEEKKYQASQNTKSQEMIRNPVWSRVLGDKISAKKPAPDKTEVLKQVKKVMDDADFFVEAKPPVPSAAPSSGPEISAITAGEHQAGKNQKPEINNEPVQDLPPEKTQEKAEKPVEESKQMNLFEEKLLTAENRVRYQMIGQVFNTYWLVQFEEKLLIIDQHAAHEKVKYERLMKQFQEKQVLSQQLLPPVIVSLSGQEEAVYKEHRDTFAALGFEAESFGGSEYAIRAVPVDLYGCGEKEMFLEVLDELAEGGIRGNVRCVEEKIASMSCKAAVKGNNRLSTEEAQQLIDELLTLENPYHCPHGRPTIITMTQSEMEKKFKRIVT